MHFELTQHFAAAPRAVARAYADPALYDRLDDLPKIGGAEVLGRHEDDGEVDLRVRYRFVGDLSTAVRAVVDPAKLSWVEVSHHRLADTTVTFRLEPDNYADRLSCQGDVRYEASGEGARRLVTGELKVRMALVGGQVERAIVSGLREHLEAEAPVVDRFLGDR